MPRAYEWEILSPVRDFVDVRDMARAIVDLTLTSSADQLVNIGTGVPTSVDAMINRLARASGRPIQIESDPTKIRKVDRQYLCADTTKLQHLLGYTPRTATDELLEQLIAESRSCGSN